jgi:predicted ATPase/transcriptional regulator with XRE-family HTH domain
MTSLSSQSFGDLLRRHRLAAGLTQEELAARAGLSVRGLSDLERGARLTPRRETVQLLCEALPLSESERVQLEAAARQRRLRHPSLKTFEIRPSNLPVQWTPLIGREREVAAVQHLLSREGVRLVTLTGPGGTGKTRLGVQVAAELTDRFPDGVHFVNLAPISDHAFVISAIAQTLGHREVADQSLLEHLKGKLQEQQVLLLLDNVEQVVRAAPQFVDLLAACPGLKLLVTSRAALHVSAEHLFPVPSLALPDLAQLPKQEDLEQYAAVSLFVQRAQAVKPDFQLTSTNAHTIAEICVRLDGLPLAIELAAVRIRLFPPHALLSRLSHRLQVLTGGSQTLPARQQTLRNTIKWSYDLLNKQEQLLYRKLSIFVGGCTLDAAEALCGTRSEGSTVLDGVASLIERSLLHQVEQAWGEPRFAMLETIREYGLELLATTGELESDRKEHARYFLTLAEQAQLELHGPNQTAQLELLEQEHDNLRAALEWTLEEGADERMRERSELALQLSVALWEFWRINGYYQEGRMFLERALAQSQGEKSSLRAKALRAAADLAIWQGDHVGVDMLAQQSLALYRELGDNHGIVNCLFLLGGIAWRRGKIVEALNLYEERVQILREIGEQWEVGQALYYLADLASIHGEYERSQSLFEEALFLFRNIGNELWAGGTLVHSAVWLHFSLGNIATIRQRLQEGQALITKVGNRHWSAECSWLTALLALSEGEVARASSLTRESLASYREIGDPWYVALMLHTLGRVEAKRGEMTTAYSLFQESIALSQEQGEQFIIPLNLEGLAGVLTSLGECRSAAQLWGAAQALREGIDSPLPPFDHVDYAQKVATSRTACGEQDFDGAWQKGRTMTLEQTLASQRRIEKPGSSSRAIP